MNYPELFYNLTKFIFSSLFIYIGFIIILLILKGSFGKGAKKISDFFKGNYQQYKARKEAINQAGKQLKDL